MPHRLGLSLAEEPPKSIRSNLKTREDGGPVTRSEVPYQDLGENIAEIVVNARSCPS